MEKLVTEHVEFARGLPVGSLEGLDHLTSDMPAAGEAWAIPTTL